MEDVIYNLLSSGTSITFAVVCAGLAKYFDRNMVAWGIGGFFCGFFALIALVATSATGNAKQAVREAAAAQLPHDPLDAADWDHHELEPEPVTVATGNACPECECPEIETSALGDGLFVHACSLCEHIWQT